MRVVVALGGNALLKRGEPMTAEVQRSNVKRAAQELALLARHHQLIISHGNVRRLVPSPTLKRWSLARPARRSRRRGAHLASAWPK